MSLWQVAWLDLNVGIPLEESRLQRQIHIQSTAFFHAAYNLGLSVNLHDLFPPDNDRIDPRTEDLRGRHKYPFLFHIIGRASAISNDDSSSASPPCTSRRIFRRQRSPSHVLFVTSPFHPCRGPFGVRHPNPALVRVFIPSAIVIGDFGKGLVGIKIPANLIVIDPISPRVRFPVLWQPTGLPDLANGVDFHKLSLRGNALTKEVYRYSAIGLRYLSDCGFQKWRRRTDQ